MYVTQKMKKRNLHGHCIETSSTSICLMALPTHAHPEKWNESLEEVKFAQYWSETNKYIIEIDDKSVGWLTYESDGQTIFIHNVFIEQKWQKHGIIGRYFKEMTPIWRSQGLAVEVSLLKNGSFTTSFTAILRNLGYKSTQNRTDVITEVVRAD
jgi:hypothetical protein